MKAYLAILILSPLLPTSETLARMEHLAQQEINLVSASQNFLTIYLCLNVAVLFYYFTFSLSGCQLYSKKNHLLIETLDLYNKLLTHHLRVLSSQPRGH